MGANNSIIPISKPKFRYNKLSGLENTFINVKIISCSRDFLWYKDMIGDIVSAEIRGDIYYVPFPNNGNAQRGGLIDLIDGKIIK